MVDDTVTLDKNESAAETWMPCPSVKLEYPGLAYIYPLDELIVVKQTDAFHDLIGQKNYSTGYTIFNNLGQKVFIATEKKRCTSCYIKIFNHYGNEIIQVEKPFKPCKRERYLVWAPPGNFLGVVKKLPTCVNTYSVKNWYGMVVLKIRARGLFKFEYEVLSHQGVVGKLAPSLTCTAVLGMKKFGITFPLDMNVLDKAVLVGACFIIGCLKYRRSILL